MDLQASRLQNRLQGVVLQTASSLKYIVIRFWRTAYIITQTRPNVYYKNHSPALIHLKSMAVFITSIINANVTA